jgi:pimeloyl-ACP methyl ester carboxylesterase
VEACLSEVGTNARYFTTAEAAQDLDYVRTTLGYRSIDLYGISYGVTLGLAYIQRYGSHVRSAVFDSGSLLDTPLWQEAPLHAQQAFDLLVQRCQATPVCARSYNPAADLETILGQLKAGPAHAVATALDDVDDYYLGESTASVLLPADLHLAASRGMSALIQKRKSWFVTQLSPQSTLLMTLSVECGDTWAAIDPKAIDTNSRFAPMMVARVAYMNTLCPLWPHNPGVSGLVRTTAPILFLNGAADPTDPSRSRG